MHAPVSMKRPLTVAPVAAKPPRAAGPSWSTLAAQGALALGTVVLVWAGASGARDEPESTLAHDVQAFQQQVMPDAGTPPAAAAEALAQRYLQSLSPGMRRDIGQQVRAEQQAGLTPTGNDAFVLRRLALYEEALQAVGTAPQATAAAAGAAR